MNSSKRGLGKGLGALLPDMEKEVEHEAPVSSIKVKDIFPNPYQPRKDFDEEKLKELAESIKQHGVLQPVIVTPGNENNYILIAGERRLRACKIAGVDEIPVVIRNADDNTLLQIALIENLQRDDLNPVEEAVAYKKLIEDFNLTQEDLAGRLGKSRTAIANTMRLLQLSEEVKKAIREGNMTAGQARPLLAEKDEEVQAMIAKEIIGKNLTAREVEKIVSNRVNDNQGNRDISKNNNDKEENNLFWEEVKEELQSTLGTKVRINRKKKSGVIEIEFFGEEDLERVASLISRRDGRMV